MQKTDEKPILGEKTRSKILEDAETRFIQFAVGLIFIVGTIILLTILSIKPWLDKTLEIIAISVLIFLPTVGLILFYLSNRCVFCDHSKWRELWGNKYISGKKMTYICYKCNLSDARANEILDMLERGVEINSETIARFNKRDL